MGHTHIEPLWPPAPFRETWMEMKLGLAQSHFLYRICYCIPSFVQCQNSFIYVYFSLFFNDWVHIPFCCNQLFHGPHLVLEDVNRGVCVGWASTHKDVSWLVPNIPHLILRHLKHSHEPHRLIVYTPPSLKLDVKCSLSLLSLNNAFLKIDCLR